MKKKTSDLGNSPIGENTVLTLTVPVAVHVPAYARSLQKISSLVTVPGFRTGKAPSTLVETHVGPAKILDQVLEDVLPEIYAKAIKEAGIEPLVHPHLEVKELPPTGDWTVTATTAVAPTIILNDWKKTAKQAHADFAKQDKPKQEKDAKAPSEEELKQQRLSFVFGKLIEVINPKIAPMLLEHETKHQIEEFAKHLAEHRMELGQYLQATGKTVEMLQQDYAASSLATLQLEFLLDAITAELDPKPTEQEISALLGEQAEKMSAKDKARFEQEAIRILRRRAVIDSIQSME